MCPLRPLTDLSPERYNSNSQCVILQINFILSKHRNCLRNQAVFCPTLACCRCAESRNAAAGGRGRHCGITAAVGESEEQRKPERFSGYRKAERTVYPRTKTLRRAVIGERQLSPPLYSARSILLRGRDSPLARTLETPGEHMHMVVLLDKTDNR